MTIKNLYVLTDEKEDNYSNYGICSTFFKYWVSK